MVSRSRTPASTQLPSVTVTGVRGSYAPEARASRDRPTRAILSPSTPSPATATPLT